MLGDRLMLVQNKREKQAKKISEENKHRHTKFVDLSLQTCFFTIFVLS